MAVVGHSAIKASYRLGVGEFRTLIRARQERSGRTVWHRILAVMALYLAVVLGLAWWEGTLSGLLAPDSARLGGSVTWLIGGLILVMLMVPVIDLVFSRLVYPLLFRRYSQAGKSLALSFAEDGLMWSGDGVEGRLAWSAVEGLTLLRDGSAAVAWISRVEGLLMPRHAFASPAEFEAACALVRRKLIGRTPMAVPDAPGPVV